MGVFCSPFRGPVPLLDPFFRLIWAVLSLLSVWFLFFSLVPLLLWLLCVVSFCLCFGLLFCGCLLLGLCVPPLVLRGFLVCCFCCAVWWLPSPAGCCLPPPLRLFPCGVLVQLLCWSLPLGIWLLHATARLPCPNAWGVVVLCSLASSCFMAAKAFGPVWGFVLPSTPWCMCCCGALCSWAEVFILG